MQSNASLLQACGVPFSLYESQEMFDDLLMHGSIDHHDDPTHFFVGQLSTEQRDTLVEIVERDLRAGFPDPGLGCFMGPGKDEVFRRLGIKPFGKDA